MLLAVRGPGFRPEQPWHIQPEIVAAPAPPVSAVKVTAPALYFTKDKNYAEKF